MTKDEKFNSILKKHSLIDKTNDFQDLYEEEIESIPKKKLKTVWENPLSFGNEELFGYGGKSEAEKPISEKADKFYKSKTGKSLVRGLSKGVGGIFDLPFDLSYNLPYNLPNYIITGEDKSFSPARSYVEKKLNKGIPIEGKPSSLENWTEFLTGLGLGGGVGKGVGAGVKKIIGNKKIGHKIPSFFSSPGYDINPKTIAAATSGKGLSDLIGENLGTDTIFGRAATVGSGFVPGIGAHLQKDFLKNREIKFAKNLENLIDEKKLKHFTKNDLPITNIGAVLKEGVGNSESTLGDISRHTQNLKAGSDLRSWNKKVRDFYNKKLNIGDVKEKNLGAVGSDIVGSLKEKITGLKNTANKNLSEALSNLPKLKDVSSELGKIDISELIKDPESFKKFMAMKPNQKQSFLENEGLTTPKTRNIELYEGEVPLANINDPRYGKSQGVIPEKLINTLEKIYEFESELPSEFSAIRKKLQKNNGMLTLDDMQNLRTSLSEATDQSGFGKKYKKPLLIKFHKAIGEDMRDAFKKIDETIGGNRLKKFDDYSKTYSEELFGKYDTDFLKKALAENPNSENLLKAIVTDFTKEGSAKRGKTGIKDFFENIDQKTLKSFASQIIFDMGFDPAQNNFNPNKFVKKYNSMETPQKNFFDTLYKKTNKDEKFNSLRDISDAIRMNKSGFELANTSGTSGHLTPALENLSKQNLAQTTLSSLNNPLITLLNLAQMGLAEKLKKHNLKMRDKFYKGDVGVENIKEISKQKLKKYIDSDLLKSAREIFKSMEK